MLRITAPLCRLAEAYTNLGTQFRRVTGSDLGPPRAAGRTGDSVRVANRPRRWPARVGDVGAMVVLAIFAIICGLALGATAAEELGTPILTASQFDLLETVFLAASAAVFAVHVMWIVVEIADSRDSADAPDSWVR